MAQFNFPCSARFLLFQIAWIDKQLSANWRNFFRWQRNGRRNSNNAFYATVFPCLTKNWPTPKQSASKIRSELGYCKWTRFQFRCIRCSERLRLRSTFSASRRAGLLWGMEYLSGPIAGAIEG